MFELIFALCMNVAGSILTSLGMSLQKYAHRYGSKLRARARARSRSASHSQSQLPSSSDSTLSLSMRAEEEFGYLRNTRWLAGFGVFVVGQLLILVSLGYGSQSLLSVLTAIQLITNDGFASYFFHEHLSFMGILSTGVILIGSVGIVLINSPVLRPNADAHQQEYDAQTLYNHFVSPPFISYLVTIFSLLIICIACEYYQSYQQSQDIDDIDLSPSPTAYPREYRNGNGISSSSSYTNGKNGNGTQTQSHSVDMTSPLIQNITPTSYSSISPSVVHPSQYSPPTTDSQSTNNHTSIASPLLTTITRLVTEPPEQHWSLQYVPSSPFLYALQAALLGACVSILGKIAMLLIRTSLDDENQFIYPFTYIICISLVISAITNIHFLNHALKSKEQLSIVYPIYFASNIVATIVGGLIFYEEYRGQTILNACIFAISIVLVLIGVVGLSRKQGHSHAANPSTTTSTCTSPNHAH